MFLFDFFHSLLPLHNPIGFGASDFIELALAALLVLLTLVRAEAEPVVQRLAKRTAWCMVAIAALPLLLRLALLPHAPAPTPSGSDDFSYWLLADTLRHFRLANPAHPLGQFFETVFVLQEPSYSSIFPLGQGLALALGWLIFGHPWAGVLLSVAALCALTYWALRAWTTPGWALVGGLLAVMHFGVLSYWVNTYWGGAVSGIAGCLVFGALPRLSGGGRARDGAALGIGLGLQLLSRPFEFGVMLLCAAGYLLINRQWRAPHCRIPWRAAALAFLPALGLMALQNHAVTGSWTTLPYQLSRYQYGVPTTFTFQANPVPHRTLTPAQQLDYQAQAAVHNNGGLRGSSSGADRILSLLFPGAALSRPAGVPASIERAQVSVGRGDTAGVCRRGQFLSLLLSALYRRTGLSVPLGGSSGARTFECPVAISRTLDRAAVRRTLHFLVRHPLHA
jgi:hypothetical protein